MAYEPKLHDRILFQKNIYSSDGMRCPISPDSKVMSGIIYEISPSKKCIRVDTDWFLFESITIIEILS